MNTPPKAPARQGLAWLLFTVSMVIGLYLENPAVALLGAAITRLVTSTNPVPKSSKTSKLSLQAAIILLGFGLTLDRVAALSVDYGLIVVAFIVGTLVLGFALAKLLRCDAHDRVLLSGGTAICGGTAIATLAPVIGAKAHQVAAALALVFLLNALALFTFPSLGHWLDLSQEQFGAWVALAVHDTSSVVATASIYGDEAAEVATTVKLGRTLGLVPLVLFVSVVSGAKNGAKVKVPGFVLLFLVATAAGSFLPMGQAVLQVFSTVSKALLVLALGLIGLEIHRDTFRMLSMRTLVLAVGLWLLVAPLALFLVRVRG